MFKSIVSGAKTVFKWIFSKDTLANVAFSLRLAKEVFSDGTGNNQKKNEELVRKLEIAQDYVDKINRVLPNTETQKYADGINTNIDEKTWGDFSAKIVPGKHGSGNNGIDLGINTEIADIPISLSYDPTNGSAGGRIGPFGFNL